LKYGALSCPAGAVRLTWRFDTASSSVVLCWVETGGPKVDLPRRRGMGSRLLTSQPGLDAVSIDYRPEGVVCEIRIVGAALVEAVARPLRPAATSSLAAAFRAWRARPGMRPPSRRTSARPRRAGRLISS